MKWISSLASSTRDTILGTSKHHISIFKTVNCADVMYLDLLQLVTTEKDKTFPEVTILFLQNSLLITLTHRNLLQSTQRTRNRVVIL